MRWERGLEIFIDGESTELMCATNDGKMPRTEKLLPNHEGCEFGGVAIYLGDELSNVICDMEDGHDGDDGGTAPTPEVDRVAPEVEYTKYAKKACWGVYRKSTGRAGYNLHSSIKSVEECQSKCSADEACQAIDFGSENERCYTYTGVPDDDHGGTCTASNAVIYPNYDLYIKNEKCVHGGVQITVGEGDRAVTKKVCPKKGKSPTTKRVPSFSISSSGNVYVIKNKGDVCDSASDVIRTKNECEEALTALGKSGGITWTGTYSKIPAGCSYNPNPNQSHRGHFEKSTTGVGKGRGDQIQNKNRVSASV